MKKFVFFVTLFLFLSFTAIYFGLTHSSCINNFVFSNIVNPYDPLEVQTSQPSKKEMQITEEWEDPRGLFPIFAYNIPDGTKDLSASLKIIERGGINILINGNLGWMPDPYKLKDAFNKLGSSDLRWLATIENECKDDFIYDNSNNETNKNIKTYLKEFNDEFVYGWYIWDEPGRNRELCSPLNLVPNNDNDDINTIVKQIRGDSEYNNKLDFVNLYPTYWEGTPTPDDYEKYIDAFFASQEFKPRVLCFDHYPLLKTEAGGFRKDYYLNLEIIRNKSLQYEVPFWMIILSSGHDHYKNPTFEEISLQVYSALAYGVKGIGYYVYSKSFTKMDYSSWILEDYVDNPNVADSLHGPLFEPVKQLNQNVQKIGKVLSRLESIKVIHTSHFPNDQIDIDGSILNRNERNSLIQDILNTEDAAVIPNLLIGVFANEDGIDTVRKYLLFVNKDVEFVSEFRINLNKKYSLYKFNSEDDKFSIISTDQFIDLRINPGSSELISLR